jgi:hypothetical protein
MKCKAPVALRDIDRALVVRVLDKTFCNVSKAAKDEAARESHGGVVNGGHLSREHRLYLVRG